MAVQVSTRRFTVEEYHRMADAGILEEDDRVELLDGEIVLMAAIGSRHAACVDRLCQLFVDRAKRRAIVRVQNPITLGAHSEPEPDLVLAKPRPGGYAEAHPRADDILLVVEVAETSQRFDGEVKLPLYARFGVPEVWIVDLEREQIEPYRNPSPEGYREAEVITRGGTRAPQALPDVGLAADEILG